MTESDILNVVESWQNFHFALRELEQNPEYIPVLMKVAIYSDQANSWRALYLADKLHDLHPRQIAPYVPEMIEQLKREQHHGKKRHLLKLISQNQIHPDTFGFLLDYCMNTFTSDKEPVANRVHAMQILFNISETEPALKPELCEIILQEMEFHPTPGIISRGKKLTRKLQQQIRKL
ncbi:hypothetical protein [Maribellus sp. YY47]|uniref:hypothetical protein n=1 Tax=Maribellus sp. YY47 TaxID=2929486 RepID=UPI002000D18E|nr:hypothetical protein [Maribellus sp. YY47]MCK3683887.1 hypothetical protein [Maribellus sp. YY47]